MGDGDEAAGTDGALREAQRTIELQQQEIERLQRRAADERFAEDLREALALVATTGAIAAPSHHSTLLQAIVETAARVIPSDAASLFLLDAEAQELIFEVALGQKADEVKSFRVPVGHGIAGLVAVSGQPMTISDAESDPRHASDISRSVGYTPRNILCCPLVYNDQVVGVLELLDRRGADFYSPADIDTLWYFAEQAAIALEQSRTYRNLAGIVSSVLERTGRHDGLIQRTERFVHNLEEDHVYRRSLALADLVREIAWRGEDEVALCEEVLRSFAHYLRARSTLPSVPGGAS
jgi:transcriptional regulator with GAF, ATPase, and Fis domain